MRATAWLGTALFCAYGFIDYLLNPASLAQTAPLRIAAAATCAVLARTTRVVRFAEVATGMAVAVSVVGAAVVATVFFGVHRRVDLGLVGEFQIMLVMMTLLPIRPVVRAAALAVIVCANVGLVVNAVVPHEALIANGLLGAGVLMMIIVSERSHAAFRRTLALEARLRHEALIDGLTQVMNRRAFFAFANKAWSACTRSNRPMCVLLIDVDAFKAVNDTHGHAAGDALLCALARALTVELRAGDLLARYGGEEFAVALPETSRRDGLVVAERLRLAAATAQIDGVTAPVRCTVSIGLAVLEHEPVPLEYLLRDADKALYVAKDTGRDRVVG